MPQLTLWVRGLSRDQILLYIPWHWVTFPSHFFFCPAVKNDSFKGNWNSKKRKKTWKRLLNNFQLWLGIGEIENRLEERWLSSHALDFGWVLVQDNHFLEGELQGDSEITFLFLDPQQRHCGGIRQSPKKPLKETDYEKHEIQAPPLHSTAGSMQRPFSSSGAALPHKRARLSPDNSGKWNLEEVELAVSGSRRSLQNIHKSPGMSLSLCS